MNTQEMDTIAHPTHPVYDVVGKTMPCQFGNPWDKSGYSIQDVIVLGANVGRFMTSYLVMATDGRMFGQAVLGAPQLQGEGAYSTNARIVGTSVVGVVKSVDSLGFDLFEVVDAIIGDAVFNGVMAKIFDGLKAAGNEELVKTFTKIVRSSLKTNG